MSNTSTRMEQPPLLSSTLSNDQVATILEHMRREQSRLLHEQQDAIVAKVLQALHQNGVACGGTTGSTSPSKLEQSLHSLVLHSLEESGLNYPHVLRGSVLSQEPSTNAHSIPKTKAHRTHKTIVVSRNETTSLDTDDLASGPNDLQTAETHKYESVDRSASATRETKDPTPVSAQVSKSPLNVSAIGRDSRRKKPTPPRQRQRRPRVETDENDPEDAAFSSVRAKVGHKTLAILDRSRALLDEMKRLPTAHYRQYNSPNPTFVDRMRKTVATVEAQLDPAQDDTDSAVVAQQSPPSSPTLRTDDEPEQGNQFQRPPTQEIVATPNEPKPACAEIEILEAPPHAPENEDEWENELARQILTIYATSVKAKRGSNRPASHGNHDNGNALSSAAERLHLGTSCSLPAIHRGKAVPSTAPRNAKRDRSPPRLAVQYSWEPSQRLGDGRVVVNMPKVPKPIWFAGTGAVKAVWCAIAEGFQGLLASPSKSKGSGHRSSNVAVCEHQLCEEVRRLEAKQQYAQCITTLETLIVSLVRARGVDALESKLWKQLVVTCNAFASRCVDYKKFGNALQLIQLAEHLLHNSILVDDAMRLELVAYLYDTYAHYYYRRGKSHAGLQYMAKAHEIHDRQSSWAHVAKCRLHMANLLSLQGKHADAMTHMASILTLIEENKLEDANADGASAQKVCLAAVCYNNMAIEQLHLRQFEAASVSTGNAKRLAKLCLSYSNRWLAQFDATSNCVDLAIATLMEDVNASANAAYK